MKKIPLFALLAICLAALSSLPHDSWVTDFRKLSTAAMETGADWVVFQDTTDNKIKKAKFDDFNPTGWAEYRDTLFTSSSPFNVSSGSLVTLPNRSHVKLESQLPPDITEFYSAADSTITGRNGDGLSITLEFVVEPTSSLTERLLVSIDIGGSVGEIYPRDFGLTKGIGEPHYYLSSFSGYTLNTWEANGGKIKVQPIGGGVDIYNVRYVISRTHKAR